MNIYTPESESLFQKTAKTMATATGCHERDIDVPDLYICPITLRLMSHPMMTRHGHNFERPAVIQWLNSGNHYCPLTRKPMSISDLLPNRHLQEQIRSWRTQNAIPEPQTSDSEFLPLIIIHLSESKKQEILMQHQFVGL